MSDEVIRTGTLSFGVPEVLASVPERTNEAPYGHAWLIEIELDGKPPSGLLLSTDECKEKQRDIR